MIKRRQFIVLTINYDLGLLGLSCANAGDVADVWARISDIDTVDGQDLHGLCGVRQRLTVGLRVH